MKVIVGCYSDVLVQHWWERSHTKRHPLDLWSRGQISGLYVQEGAFLCVKHLLLGRCSLKCSALALVIFQSDLVVGKRIQLGCMHDSKIHVVFGAVSTVKLGTGIRTA